MTAINVDAWYRERLNPNVWARNGMLVGAAYQAKMCEVANQIVRLRPRELATFSGNVSPQANSTWRFEAHTSPKCATIVLRVVLAKSDNPDLPPQVHLNIENTSGVQLASGIISGGLAIGETVNDVPDEWTVQSLFLDARTFADTTIRGTLASLAPTDAGRIVAATIYEWALPPDTDNGYLPQAYSVGQGIYEKDRQKLAELALLQWKRGAAHVLNFSSETDSLAPTNATTSYKNLLDDSAVSNSETAGYYIDLRVCGTKTRNVPCRFAARFKSSTGTSVSVQLRDATNTVLATLSTTSTTPVWVQTTVTLPPTLQKLDVGHLGAAGPTTITTYAASLYQYMT